MSTAPVLLSATLLLGAVVGCSEREPALRVTPPPVETPAATALTPASVPIDTARRTTDPFIAVGNRNGRIDVLRERVVEFPRHRTERSLLIDLLLARSGTEGTYNDFAEVDALTMGGLEREPELAAAHQARAGYLSAVHDFDESLAELEIAESLGGRADQIERRRIAIGVAVGDDPEPLITRTRSLLEEGQTLQLFVTLATALSAAGRFEEADAAFVDGLEAYVSASPFTIATVQFQRGVMWAEQADRADLGILLYREAVRRLPQYVVANVHLAELESERDETPAALARLRPLAEQSAERDPEPAGLLAELLMEDQPDEAATLRERARARYEVLLARQRAAFLDHGAEFFTATDPTRALAMARENIAARPYPRAYAVAIEAALAADDTSAACSLGEDARGVRGRSRALDNLIDELDCD